MNHQKKLYQTLDVAVIMLANADIITLSNQLEFDPSEEEEEGEG